MAEPSAAEPGAAEPSVSSKEYNATPDAVDGLADALADPETTADTEVDVPEPVGLQEQETDTVLDKTPSTDALYGVVCQSFDDEKLGARPWRGWPDWVGSALRPRSGRREYAGDAQRAWAVAPPASDRRACTARCRC
jgi:hypothetical protein